MAPGEPSRDLIKLIRPALRMDLRAALHQAAHERGSVRVEHVPVPSEQGGGSVTLSVRPVISDRDRARTYLLVMFESGQTEAGSEPAVKLVSPTDEPVTELEHELTQVKAQLRATIEQYETHVEEAKAANEELQAMNEELRSAAEELETSKEELQSVNEELTTVNQELKLKIEQLALANNDLQNFINSTDIATIFLDRSLRVKLFTARARDVFNLLPNDVGRPLSDITNVLRYDGLPDDMKEVLNRLQAVNRQVQTQSGQQYVMRVLPYRTADDRIDGVVLTFVAIGEQQDAANATTS
jgi:two-component system, chemotaxis family, CheB/CheR fusion protein